MNGDSGKNNRSDEMVQLGVAVGCVTGQRQLATLSSFNEWKTNNLSEGGGTCTQQTRNFTPDSNSSSCKDKKHSVVNKQESKSKRMRNGVGVWRHSIWRGKR